jgi:hypothetical protein
MLAETIDQPVPTRCSCRHLVDRPHGIPNSESPNSVAMAVEKRKTRRSCCLQVVEDSSTKRIESSSSEETRLSDRDLPSFDEEEAAGVGAR